MSVSRIQARTCLPADRWRSTFRQRRSSARGSLDKTGEENPVGLASVPTAGAGAGAGAGECEGRRLPHDRWRTIQLEVVVAVTSSGSPSQK